VGVVVLSGVTKRGRGPLIGGAGAVRVGGGLAFKAEGRHVRGFDIGIESVSILRIEWEESRPHVLWESVEKREGESLNGGRGKMVDRLTLRLIDQKQQKGVKRRAESAEATQLALGEKVKD